MVSAGSLVRRTLGKSGQQNEDLGQLPWVRCTERGRSV